MNALRQILAHEQKTFLGLITALLLLAAGAAAFGAEGAASDAEARPAAGQTTRGARQAPAARQGSVARQVPTGRGAVAAAPDPKQQQIAAEIQKVGQELAPLFASPQDLFEPAKRQAAAPAAVPALRKMVKLLDELIASRPAGAPQGQERIQLMALMSALGDQEAAAKLQSMASSPVAAEAAAGRSAQLFAAWLLTDGKPAGQKKVVDDLAALAKRYPAEPTVAGAAIMVSGTTRSDAQETRKQIYAIVTDTLKSPAAAVAARQIEAAMNKFDALQKLKALEGKPLKLEGPTPYGGIVSTAELRGKVVIVDFWATWCGPCREELPKLKKFYAQHRSQGLEIVGVSCDNDGQELVKFLQQNRDMPWPQLFDASQPGWHALAAQFDINSIPTMFIIDRKGVLRSVEGRENYEKLVPELLKEPG